MDGLERHAALVRDGRLPALKAKIRAHEARMKRDGAT
jgi:hypothetical protein